MKVKTLIQLDVQNLFLSAKNLGKKIDFYKIKEHFHGRDEEIVDMVAYTARSNEPSSKGHNFENLLKALGYTLSPKIAQLVIKPDGRKFYKGTDQDMSICVDCMKRINEFDKWVLMSGDGDFIDLCVHLKKHNKIVEIWSLPGVSFNKKLCDYADSIHFLNENFFYYEKEKEDKNEKPGNNLS
jgi:uncharacterized LabA/DUF88 family protein